jgi:hypothetical protein
MTNNETFKIEAKYGQLESSTSTSVYFVDPIFFGELKCDELFTTHAHNVDYDHENTEKTSNDPSTSKYYNFGWLFNTKEVNEETFTDSESIRNLPKYISNTPEHTYEISTDPENPGHICYAYPAIYGTLRYIKDTDGYIYYDSELDAGYEPEQSALDNAFFCIKNAIIDPWANQEQIAYNVYISKVPTYVNSLQMSFKKPVEVVAVGNVVIE